MSDVGAVKYKVELDDSGIDQETAKAESKIAAGFKGAAGAVGSAVSAAAKVGAAAVAAGSTAVAGLVKTATDAYGDFEQLSGGVETLFGDSASKVMANAEQAFKSAGMSMNDYMETSIQSAASLINSLGGDQAKAAELMDMSIVDMADNVNKMGTDMEAVQNAYRGFSRGNFTMLDNLALGFAGTKEGMQQLLDSAQKISGVKYDISSYSDIVQAIHVVQTEMGITGTTAKEASETLQGSMGQMKSAWTNFTAGLANPDADLGKLIGDMVDSAQTFLDNLIPIIQETLPRIIDAIGELAPMLVETFIPMFVDLIPDLIDAGMQLAGAVGQGLVDAAPDLAFAAFDIIEMLLNSMLEATSTEGPGAITEILSWIIGIFEENYVGLIDTGLQIIENLLNGMIEAVPEILTWLPMIVEQISAIIIENAPLLIEAAADLILTLATGIADMIPDLIPTIVDVVLAIVEALIDNVDQLVDAAIAITMALADGLIEALPKLLEKAPEIIAKLVEAIVKNVPKLAEAALKLIVELAGYIVKNLPQIVKSGAEIVSSLIKGIFDLLKDLGQIGKDMINEIWNAIKSFDPIQWGKDLIGGFIDGIKGGWETLKGAAGGAAEAIASRLHFSVPDEGPLSDADQYMPDFINLLAGGLEKGRDKLADASEDLAGDIAMGFTSDINYNMPDLAGYAKDLSASITGTGSSRIEVPVILDGREIARASAWYMGEQLAWEAR